MEGLSRSRSTAGTKVTGYQTTLATLRPLPRVARPVKDGVGRTDTVEVQLDVSRIGNIRTA
jgi:hypothetical protein